MPKFVGGPYDGMDITIELIRKHATQMPPIQAGRQTRRFVLMPPRAEWERICRGEMTIDDDSVGPYHPYEKVNVSAGVEYHDADTGRLDEASAGKEDPAFTQAMDDLSS